MAATTMQNNDKNLKLEIENFLPLCELVFSKRLLQTFLSQRLDAINDWFGIWEKNTDSRTSNTHSSSNERIVLIGIRIFYLFHLSF